MLDPCLDGSQHFRTNAGRQVDGVDVSGQEGPHSLRVQVEFYRNFVYSAGAVVPKHGLYGTARPLGVSCGALKRHVDRRARHARARPAVSFVELPRAAAETSVIEIEGAGTTVRLRVSGLALSDLAAFARQLVGAAS